MQNFPQKFQMPLSQKEKPFSQSFISFLKCAWNIEHFEKKDEYRNLITSEIIESEKGSYFIIWKVLLQNTIR